MKKILILALMIGVLFGITGILALDTSTYLQDRGVGTAALSSEHAVSGSQSARLYAPYISPPGYDPINEGRVRIEFPDDFTLNQLINISWMQYVEQGYIAHVDVYIDTNDDGDSDDALVFEYAKVNPSDCDDSEHYPIDKLVNTFDDKGFVDNNAYAWLNSGDPGPCGGGGFIHKSLADWQTDLPTADIIAIEIEVDGWIAESEAFIDNVIINGELIEDFEGTQTGSGEIVPDMTFIPNPNPLNFGFVAPGRSSEVVSTLSVGNSNLNVTLLSVTNITGEVFNETNVLFSTDNGSTYETVDDLDPFTINAQDSFDLYVQLNVPIATPSKSFSGLITYTVMEA